MIEALKKQGFRNFVIKCVIYVLIFILLQVVISNFISDMAFFKTYLEIPRDFYIEAPMIRLYMMNALIFGLVAFILRSYHKIKNISNFKFKNHQYIFLGLAIFFFTAHYLLKFLINQNTDFFLQNATFWAIIKYSLNVLFAIALGLGIFGLDFIKHIFKEYKKEILFFIIICVSFFILMRLVQDSWTFFSSTISNMLHWIFKIFFEDVTYKPFVATTSTSGGGPLLGIGNFKAIVGKSCSGIDSFLLFTSLYVLMFIMDYKRLKKPIAIILFFVGAIGMFLTNALRILLLFIVGAFYDAKFAVGMFHTNAGWVLFIAYFFIFWWIASKYIYKNEKKKKD